MYRPKGKISKPKYSNGTFEKPDGTPYVGFYFEDSAGNQYTGKSPGKNSIPLIDTTDTEGINFTPTPGFNFFSSEVVFPTEEDYENGFFIRYFLQDSRSSKIIEVGKNKYNSFRRKGYINSVTIEWLLTTPIENVEKGPYVYFGSKAKNKETVEKQENIPNLSSYIKNFAQFIKE